MGYYSSVITEYIHGPFTDSCIKVVEIGSPYISYQISTRTDVTSNVKYEYLCQENSIPPGFQVTQNFTIKFVYEQVTCVGNAKFDPYVGRCTGHCTQTAPWNTYDGTVGVTLLDSDDPVLCVGGPCTLCLLEDSNAFGHHCEIQFTSS